MLDYDAARLTFPQKPDNFYIHEGNIRQIKNHLTFSFRKQAPQLIEMVHLQPTDQADRCPSILKTPFDLQGVTPKAA
jgi:hypothetical protein